VTVRKSAALPDILSVSMEEQKIKPLPLGRLYSTGQGAKKILEEYEQERKAANRRLMQPKHFG
jgi:Skp family chaperone for outer membrane proteins